MDVVRPTMRTLGAVVPPLASEIAWRLWRSLGSPVPVHERDRAIHDSAVRGEIEIGGERVATYRWGSGPRVILLVHGWRSRASRFGAIVQALAAPDRTLVAFDAPGNGDSRGSLVTVLDYAEAIRQLSDQHGGVDVIVAHSFGVLATFVAVREGASARGIVAISGMHDADQLVDAFSARLGIGERAKQGLRKLIELRTFPDVDDPWHRFRSELDPTATHIPLLVVHDRGDALVDASQSDLTAAAHPGTVTSIRTDGLGHSRILGEPGVLAAIAEFAETVIARTVR